MFCPSFLYANHNIINKEDARMIEFHNNQNDMYYIYLDNNKKIYLNFQPNDMLIIGYIDPNDNKYITKTFRSDIGGIIMKKHLYYQKRGNKYSISADKTLFEIDINSMEISSDISLIPYEKEAIIDLPNQSSQWTKANKILLLFSIIFFIFAVILNFVNAKDLLIASIIRSESEENLYAISVEKLIKIFQYVCLIVSIIFVTIFLENMNILNWISFVILIPITLYIIYLLMAIVIGF